MLCNAIRGSSGGDRLMFQVILLQSAGRHVTVTFKAVCGPADDGEPVVTIMMPDED